MRIIFFINLFKGLKRLFNNKQNKITNKKEILWLDLPMNPAYPRNKLWGYRPTNLINKIVVHQAISEATTVQVNNYHISKDSHIKPGIGCPKIPYHFTIEKAGTIYKVNEITDVVWHCSPFNINSIGILLLGDFDGPTHVGKSIPTTQQLESLKYLLDMLSLKYNISSNDIYGHKELVGKENCPGTIILNWLTKYRVEKTDAKV